MSCHMAGLKQNNVILYVGKGTKASELTPKLKDKPKIALNRIIQIDSGTMMPHDIMQNIIAEDFGLF